MKLLSGRETNSSSCFETKYGHACSLVAAVGVARDARWLLLIRKRPSKFSIRDFRVVLGGKARKTDFLCWKLRLCECGVAKSALASVVSSLAKVQSRRPEMAMY